MIPKLAGTGAIKTTYATCSWKIACTTTKDQQHVTDHSHTATKNHLRKHFRVKFACIKKRTMYLSLWSVETEECC